jgi:DNA topoisomerase VI subunit B
VLVTVEDNGPGIPPDKLKAIFERFYSERPEGEKFGQHSGLGLSISTRSSRRTAAPSPPTTCRAPTATCGARASPSICRRY